MEERKAKNLFYFQSQMSYNNYTYSPSVSTNGRTYSPSIDTSKIRIPLPPSSSSRYRPMSPPRSDLSMMSPRYDRSTSPSRSMMSSPRSMSPRPIYTARSSSPSRGWKDVEPHRGPERRGLYAQCGAECFADPANLKYPMCDKDDNCRPDCRGMEAAYARARQYHHQGIADRAHHMAMENNCSWAVAPTHSPRSARASSPRRYD